MTEVWCSSRSPWRVHLPWRDQIDERKQFLKQEHFNFCLKPITKKNINTIKLQLLKEQWSSVSQRWTPSSQALSLSSGPAASPELAAWGTVHVVRDGVGGGELFLVFYYLIDIQYLYFSVLIQYIHVIIISELTAFSSPQTLSFVHVGKL